MSEIYTTDYKTCKFEVLVGAYLNTEDLYRREALAKEIYERVAKIAEYYAYECNVSKNDSDDIISMTCVKVFLNLAIGEERKERAWVCKIAKNVVLDFIRHENAKKRNLENELHGDDDFWNMVFGKQYSDGKKKQNFLGNYDVSMEEELEEYVDASDEVKYIISSGLSVCEVLKKVFELRTTAQNKIAYGIRISRTAIFNSYEDMDAKDMIEVVKEIAKLPDGVEKEAQDIFRRVFRKESIFYIMKTMERMFKYADKNIVGRVRENVEPVWKEELEKVMQRRAKKHKGLKEVCDTVNNEPIECVLEGRTLFEACLLMKFAVCYALQTKAPKSIFAPLDEQLEKTKNGEVIGNTIIHYENSRSVVDAASNIKKQMVKKYMS